MAEKIELHPTTIGKIEIGKINPSTLALYKIANVLDVSIKDLFDF